MDYKSFLKPVDPVVLPFFGGSRVDAADRRLRVDAPLAIGWWRFAIEGRRAVPQGPAEPVDLGALPAVRGHWADGWIVVSGRELGRIAIPPTDEPAPLSRVTARRWYTKELLLESVDFEDEAEDAARRALEERRPLGEVAHVVPSLRAAFAYSLGMALAREAGVELSHRELARYVVAIADRGRDGAREIFERIEAERRAAEEARLAREAVMAVVRQRNELRQIAVTAKVRKKSATPSQRADEVLEQANCRLLNCRLLAGGTELECTFRCEDVRIIATVEVETFNVIDAGFCLAGEQRQLSLDSLPSAVREAIEVDHLNITRR